MNGILQKSLHPHSDSGGEEEEEVQIQPDADRVDFLKKHTVRANKDELLKQAGTVFAPKGRSTRQSKRLKQQAPSVSALLPEASCPLPQQQLQQQRKPPLRAELPPPPCRELEPLPAHPAVLAQEAQEIQHLLELVIEPHPSEDHAAEAPAQEIPPHLHPFSSKTREHAWEDPLQQRPRRLHPSPDIQSWLRSAPLPPSHGAKVWQGGGEGAGVGSEHQGALAGQTRMPPSPTGHHSTPAVSPAPCQQRQQQQQQQYCHHPLQQILGGVNGAVGSYANVHASIGTKPAPAADTAPPWMAYVQQKGHSTGVRPPNQKSRVNASPADVAVAEAARASQHTPLRAFPSQQALGTHPGYASRGVPQTGGAGEAGLHAGVGTACQVGGGPGAVQEEQGGGGLSTHQVDQGADKGLQSHSQHPCVDPGPSQLQGGGARAGGASAAARARDRKAAKLQRGSVLYQDADKGWHGGTQKEGKEGVLRAGTPASAKGGAAAILGDVPASHEQQQKQKRGRVGERYMQTPVQQQRQRQRQQAEIVVPAGASPLDVLLPASRPCRSPTQAPWASTPLPPAPPQHTANNNAGPTAASKGGGVLAALGIGGSTPTPVPPPSTRRKGHQSLAEILLASSDEDEPGQPTATPQQPRHQPTNNSSASYQAHPQQPFPLDTQPPSTPATTVSIPTHPRNHHPASAKTAAQPPTTPTPSHTIPTPLTAAAAGETPTLATTPLPVYPFPTSATQHRPGSHARPPRPPNAIHTNTNASVAAGADGDGGGGEGAGVLQMMEAQRAQQRAVLSILPPAEPSPISRLMGSAGSLGSHGSGRVAGGGSSSDANRQGPGSQGMSGGLWGEEALPSAGAGGIGGDGIGICGLGGGTGRRGGRGGTKSRGLTGRLKQLQGVVGARQRELVEEWRHEEGGGGVATQRPAAPQPPKPTLCMTVLSSSLEAHVAKCVCACEGIADPVHVMLSNNKGDHSLDPVPGCRFVVHTPWHEFRMPPRHRHTLFGANMSVGAHGQSTQAGAGAGHRAVGSGIGVAVPGGTHGQGTQAGAGAGLNVAGAGIGLAAPGGTASSVLGAPGDGDGGTGGGGGGAHGHTGLGPDMREGVLVVIALCCTPADKP